MNQQQAESDEDLQGQLAQLLHRIEARKLNARNLDDPSVQQNASFVGFPQHPQNGLTPARRAPMARSQSNMGYSSRAAGPALMTPDASSHQAPRRERRAFSHQSHSTPSMSRSMSNRSESGMPFIPTGAPIAPLLTPPSARPSPRNDVAMQHLASVQENEVLPGLGMTPGEYLLGNYSYIDTTRTNLLPEDAYANLEPSACPSMASGSSAAEGTAPNLSRQNSFFDHRDPNMMRVVSSQSFAADSFPGPEGFAASMSQPSHSAQSFTAAKYPAPDQDFLGLGSFPGAYGSTVLPNMSLSPESATMERTDSNLSSSSNSSSKSEQRFKDAAERVRLASKAPIAPKPQETSADTAKDTAGQDSKVALNKTSYQRPRHPKVQCELCQDNPEGFRGDHELRRHMAAKHHDGLVKKFICRDPATLGLKSNVQVQHPLSKCKACMTGKQYGAYYNAAAHLRRTHFKPKGPRAKRGGDDEKRGGIGGGDWPPMEDLKLWFEETIVHVNVNASSSDDAEKNAGEPMLETTSAGFPDAVGVSPYEEGGNFDISFDETLDPNAGSFYYADASQLSMDYEFATPGTLSMGPSPNAYRDMNQQLWDSTQAI